MDAALRFLSLVAKEVGAADVRLELGGRPPASDAIVWCALDEGWRLVAVFAEPVQDVVATRDRLYALAESFDQTLAEAQATAPPLRAHRAATARTALDQALETLAEQLGATAALVVDERSPVVWGSTRAAAWLHEVDWTSMLTSLDDAPQERRPLLAAIARARESDASTVRDESGGGHLARSFSAIYRIVLVFDGDFSELHAEAALLRALPAIERLVGDLPPVDPTPKGARVLTLRRD